MRNKSVFNQSSIKDGIDNNVIIINHKDVEVDWERWYLLTSDRHWDNPHSQMALQKQHLEWARENGAGIIDCGDFFCVMQGKYDPRRDRENIRPEHNKADYIDAVINTSIDWFSPYADLFAVIGYGNHETKFLKNQDTDLIKRFVNGINYKNGTNIRRGGYAGFVRFSFSNHGGAHQSIDLYYHHGHGGGGPVTKGVIQHNRRAANVSADIIVSGHVHESWQLTNMRFGINRSGRVVQKEQQHICLRTYKDEFENGGSGWHVEQGRPPKPVGAWALRFRWCKIAKKIVFDTHVLN